MIKNVDSALVDKVITVLSLPTVADPLLQKHVDKEAILVKIVDEDIFMTEQSAGTLYESLVYMQSLGARWNQSLLVIKLMARGSARPYEQLMYWIRSGGIAIALDDDEVEPFLKSQSAWLEERYA